MADSNPPTRRKHGRRKSLTQFIPKKNIQYNPYQANNVTTNNDTVGRNTSASVGRAQSVSPVVHQQQAISSSTSSFSPRIHNPSAFHTNFSPRARVHAAPFDHNHGKHVLYTSLKRSGSYDPNPERVANGKYGAPKPDFLVKWKPNKQHPNPQQEEEEALSLHLPTQVQNGYHTSPEYDEANSTDNDTDTLTDTDNMSYDALKQSVNTASALYNGYLSDGSGLIQHNNKSSTSYTNNAKKRRIKSYKRAASKKSPKPKRIVTNIKDEERTKHVIHQSVDRFKRKKNFSDMKIRPIETEKSRSKELKKKRTKKENPLSKRHSVGHTDSSTLGMLKTRYSNGKKHTNHLGVSKEQKKKFRKTMFAEDNPNTPLHERHLNTRRRLSLFKSKIGAPTPLDTDHATFEELNSQKWNIEQLVGVETEQEFHTTLISHSKEDIIELCWDLLRSKDKSDELLRMVSVMNNHLQQEEAYDTMMETIRNTLDCKFASLYAHEEESQYLKCLWTTDGEPDKDIFISVTSSTQLAARVWQKNQSLLRSLTENNEEICPDFIGFGNVYVMGIPIRDYSQNDAKIGVLMVYRDRSKSEAFNDQNLNAAKMLTSICSTTLRNVSLFTAANEKEKRTQKILSMIDEMSGDVSEGYQTIIKKLVRKIRSLVACTHIDFWTVDLSRNKMRCEVSDNDDLQDILIEHDTTHILGQCALNGKYVKIDNASMDTRYSAEQLRFCQNGKSILVIPVRVESELEPIAVIVAINKVPKMRLTHHKSKGSVIKCIPFTHQDRRMLDTFATSASIIIKNSLLFQKINGLNRKHESMVNILKALQEKHNVTHMLSEATLAVRDAIEAERVSLWFEDGEGNLDAMDIGDVALNEEEEEEEDIDLNSDEEHKNNKNNPIQTVLVAIARHCAEDKILINTPNVFEDVELFDAITDYIDLTELQGCNEKDWLLMNRRACSVLCVPILSNDSVVGVIQSIYKRTPTDIGFTDTDQQIVESVSSEIAHTIARNISDLTLAKYVDKHDDIPLDVIEYYLTGSMQQQTHAHEQTHHEVVTSMEQADEFIVGNFKQQQEMKHPNHSHNPANSYVVVGTATNRTMIAENAERVENIYHKFVLDETLKSYCDLLPTCDFDATQFDLQQDLESFIMFALDESGLIEHFKLNCGKLQKFIHSIAKLYRTNPFHNWQHGFFVFHFVLYFIKTQADICNILNKKELLAILIAGMCHDVDHPGNDNLYEIESDSDLARIYNGLSVLENHHTYTTLALLRKADLNFFEESTISNKDIKYIKTIVTKSIMSTDMSHHNETIGWLNDFVSERILKNETLFIKNTKIAEIKKNEIKLKLCQCIVHLGDLSAQTYPWRIAKEWERRIAKEFKQQTIKEEKVNIPVRDWMANTDLAVRYKNQFFFVTHVVKPLWEPAARLFPAMEERLNILKSNSQKYIQIAKKKEK